MGSLFLNFPFSVSLVKSRGERRGTFFTARVTRLALNSAVDAVQGVAFKPFESEG